MPSLCLTIPVSEHGEIAAPVLSWTWAVESYFREAGWRVVRQIHTGKPTQSTRNLQCIEALRTECDFVLFCDADAEPDLRTTLLLVDDVQQEGVDVVGGWSLMVANGNDLIPNVGRDWTGEEWPVDRETPHREPGLYPVGAVGAHSLIVRREVLEAIRNAGQMWFEDSYYTDPTDEHFGTRSRGHDFEFCRRAKDLGFGVYCDNRVFWGHRKTTDMRAWYRRIMGLCSDLNAQKVLVDELRDRWGNVEWTAPSAFLMRMAIEAQQVGGKAVVECGSGLTTGVLRRTRHSRLIVLEDRAATDAEKVPLRSYGEYDWYDYEHEGNDIGLVVCDGPRGDTRGGRRGVCRLKPHLHPDGWTFMLDDVHRPAERKLLDEWCAGLPVDRVEIIDAGDGRRFAVVQGGG